MKKIIFGIISGIFFLISCEKEKIGIEEQNNIQKEGQAILSRRYFVDDVEVKDSIAGHAEDEFMVTVYKQDDLKSAASGRGIIETRLYSSAELYIKFGERHGYKFREQLAFEKIMRTYAENSGAIKEFEKNGVVPEWYSAREQTIHDSVFNTEQPGLKSAMALVVTLYENYYVPGVGAGSKFVMAATYPVMPPGWDNRVSCVEFVGVAGGVHIYDKNFYRSRLTTVVNTGMMHINLPAGYDNRMSSGIKIL